MFILRRGLEMNNCKLDSKILAREKQILEKEGYKQTPRRWKNLDLAS